MVNLALEEGPHSQGLLRRGRPGRAKSAGSGHSPCRRLADPVVLASSIPQKESVDKERQNEHDCPLPPALSSQRRLRLDRKEDRARAREGRGQQEEEGEGKKKLTPRSMSPTPRKVPTCLHSGSLAYSFWTTGSRQVCCAKENREQKKKNSQDRSALGGNDNSLSLASQPGQPNSSDSSHLTSGLTAALRVKVGLNLPIQLPALTMMPLARTPLAWRSSGEDAMTPARRFTLV